MPSICGHDDTLCHDFEIEKTSSTKNVEGKLLLSHIKSCKLGVRQSVPAKRKLIREPGGSSLSRDTPRLNPDFSATCKNILPELGLF